MNDKKRVFSKSHIHTHTIILENILLVCYCRMKGSIITHQEFFWGKALGLASLFYLTCPGHRVFALDSWHILHGVPFTFHQQGPSLLDPLLQDFFLFLHPTKPPPLGFVDTFPSSLELSPDSAWVGQDSLGPDWESHLLFLHRCVVVSVLPSHKQRLSPVTLQKLAEISPNLSPNTGSSSQLSYDFLQYPHSIARADDLSTILILHA